LKKLLSLQHCGQMKCLHNRPDARDWLVIIYE
jgi:hypothetical protein